MFTAVCFAFPTQVIQLFMQTTPEIIEITPGIFRVYSLSFLLLGINTFLILYLQAVLYTKMSIIVSVLRSLVLNLALIYILPIFMGGAGIWWAVVIAEGAVSVLALIYVRRIHKQPV